MQIVGEFKTSLLLVRSAVGLRNVPVSYNSSRIAKQILGERFIIMINDYARELY